MNRAIDAYLAELEARRFGEDDENAYSDTPNCVFGHNGRSNGDLFFRHSSLLRIRYLPIRARYDRYRLGRTRMDRTWVHRFSSRCGDRVDTGTWLVSEARSEIAIDGLPSRVVGGQPEQWS